MWTVWPSTTFLSTLSLRRATAAVGLNLVGQIFLSTLSLRRATRGLTLLYSIVGNFYPRSPCGERPQHASNILPDQHFYPRSPCGERRFSLCGPCGRQPHFYPRSPCGERPIGPQVVADCVGISIHALLAESDQVRACQNEKSCISIHALLAESDKCTP